MAGTAAPGSPGSLPDRIRRAGTPASWPPRGQDADRRQRSGWLAPPAYAIAMTGGAGPADSIGKAARTAGTAASAVETVGSTTTAGDAPVRGAADRRPDSGAEIARGQLGLLRHRFILRRLPPLGHLLVRQRLAGPGGCEAPWVLVTSWPVPGQLHGRCLNDAVHPEFAHIRMGRAIWVSVDSVIDWAVLDATNEIIEGGWSRGLRHAMDLPDAPGTLDAHLVPEQSVVVPERTQGPRRPSS